MVRSPRPPDVPRQLVRADIGELTDGAELTGCEIVDDFLGGAAHRAEIAEARLLNARFTGSDLTLLRLRDVLVEGCDLSGAVLEEALLMRCTFIDCRLSGTMFTSARLEHVLFQDCRMDLAGLRMASARAVRFDDCDLSGSDLYAAEIHDSQLLRCNLAGADLSASSLGGSELHGSNLDSAVGIEALRDVVVDSAQASVIGLALLDAHGISVTGEPSDD